MSRERSLGPEGGDQRRLRRQLHLDWGRVGVAWGERRFISLSLPAPGAGAEVPADRRPQPWRETRSPALARLSDGSRGRGGPGWLASCSSGAGTHNGHSAQPPPQPKTRRVLGDRRAPGSPARPAPSVRAPFPSRARLPQRAPPPLGLREPRGREEGGGGEAEGGRRPLFRCPGRGGWTEEQTWCGRWQPRAEGVLETGGARGIACPAQHCPSFPLVSPPTAGGSWEGCGCGRRARVATGLLCTPRPRAFRSWSGPIDAADTARGRLGPAGCLGCSESAPSPAAWALSSSCNFSLRIDGSCGFWAAGSLGESWFPASWRG